MGGPANNAGLVFLNPRGGIGPVPALVWPSRRNRRGHFCPRDDDHDGDGSGGGEREPRTFLFLLPLYPACSTPGRKRSHGPPWMRGEGGVGRRGERATERKEIRRMNYRGFCSGSGERGGDGERSGLTAGSGKKKRNVLLVVVAVGWVIEEASPQWTSRESDHRLDRRPPSRDSEGTHMRGEGFLATITFFFRRPRQATCNFLITRYQFI